MSYINTSEYLRITHTHDPDELGGIDLPAALSAAESVIDASTLYGYVGRDTAGLPVYVADRLKEAVAYQAQYIIQNGGLEALNSDDGALGSTSLGKYSYSRGGNGRNGSTDTSGGASLPLAPLARANIPMLRAYVRTLRKEG